MTTSSTPDLTALAERLVIVEVELAELKQRVLQPTDQPWYLKHAGIFASDPEFREIVRLGREIRVADRSE